MQLSSNETNHAIKTWADLNRHFFLRRHTDSQQVHKKIFNITNHH